MANTLILHTFTKLFFAVLSLFLIVGTCVTAVHHNQYVNQNQQQQQQTYQAYQNYQNQYPSVVATAAHVQDQSTAHSQIEDKDYATGHSGWSNSWYLLCMPIIFIPLILLLCTPLFYQPSHVPYYHDHHGPAIHHYHPTTGWKRSLDVTPSLETTGKVLKSISKQA